MGHRRSQVRLASSLATTAASLLLIGAAAAQTPLAEVIPTLLGPGMTIAPGPGGTHGNEFARAFGEVDLAYASFYDRATDSFRIQPYLTTDVRGRGFNAAVVEQLTTFPIASSSGGFLYAFDPALRTFTRASRSFGPSYGERPMTSGRGTLTLGFAAQAVEFDRFDGRGLQGGDFRFYYVHRDIVAGASLTPERSDVMEAVLRLRVRSRTTAATLAYGVTDRLDVGVTLPFVQTTLEARVDKRIMRLGTSSDATIHSFDGRGGDAITSAGGGSASGVGDVRIVAKYNFLRRSRIALAGFTEFRLPTGDSRELLGTGTVTNRTLAIVSTGTNLFSINGSLGLTYASKNLEARQFVGRPYDEMNITAGFDWSVVPSLSVSTDVLRRVRLDAEGTQKMAPEPRVLQFVQVAGGPIQTVTVSEFQPGPTQGSLSNSQVVVGAKLRTWRTALLVANVLFPLEHQAGLRNKPAVSFGVEYTF